MFLNKHFANIYFVRYLSIESTISPFYFLMQFRVTYASNIKEVFTYHSEYHLSWMRQHP